MEYGAIDLHKKESQVPIVAADGEVIDRRILTTRDRLTAVFWGRTPMRILIEASTESEWVAQHLESLGHDVIVADPNYGAMYARRSRRVKTDRRDAAAASDDQFATIVAEDLVAKRLMTVPSIGPITATAFIAALDDATRFDGAAQVTSYLGLVPREYSSGEHQHRGRILRSAHPHVQSLLVQAAWRMSRSSDAKTTDCAPGRPRSHIAAARRWPWWRSRGGSPASCLRCGATRRSIKPSVFD